MSMRNYWSEHDGPQPTPEEELKARGKLSTLGLVCAPTVVVAVLWALAKLSALLS